MDDDVRNLIQAIHDSPTRGMLVTAGAGSQALTDLLGVAGASRTLLEALVPYSSASFDAFLGQTPEQYVSADTGRMLAGRALARARQLRDSDDDRPLVGLACTATIVTDRPKRGQHRAHVGVWTPDNVTEQAIILDKGARDRAGEEAVVSRMMLNALAEACGLEARLALGTGPADQLAWDNTDFAAAAQRLEAGEVAWFGIEADGRLRPMDDLPGVVLSGSFNPLHFGHLGLAAAAAEIVGQPAVFELSAVNVDKPPLLVAAVLDRLSQFAGGYPSIASRAPTFVEKARLYPGATFVVGYDTAHRIIQPRYYGNSLDNMLGALAEIGRLGCSFLVAGRVDTEGAFYELEDLDLPLRLAGLFRSIPAYNFRRDISSSEIRADAARNLDN